MDLNICLILLKNWFCLKSWFNNTESEKTKETSLHFHEFFDQLLLFHALRSLKCGLKNLSNRYVSKVEKIVLSPKLKVDRPSVRN